MKIKYLGTAAAEGIPAIFWFDVISFDCTEANCEVVPYVGHLSLNKCIALRREFTK